MRSGSAGIDSDPGGAGSLSVGAGSLSAGAGSPSAGTESPSAGAGSSGVGTDLLERTELDESTRFDSPWLTIVWNDPVNLMTYVTHVFRTYFGYSRPEAERLMMQVHTEGKAVVASGNREEMERHVEAMHDYGLWATVGRDE